MSLSVGNLMRMLDMNTESKFLMIVDNRERKKKGRAVKEEQ